MGGPRNVHHIWKTRAGGQSLAVAWACTQSPTLPASRSGSRQPRGSGLRRLDPRPPSLDFPNQPEALATRPATDRRSGAQRPRPSSDEAWQPCAEGRTAGGALVPPSAAPGWHPPPLDPCILGCLDKPARPDAPRGWAVVAGTPAVPLESVKERKRERDAWASPKEQPDFVLLCS